MKNLLTILTVLVLFIGCQLHPEVNDVEFDKEYVQPFLQQAEAYGIPYNKYSLSIVYLDELYIDGSGARSDSGEEVAALAVWDDLTIYFNVSHPYWNSDAQIVLIYHELAHYYLGKIHIDKSVSCDVPFSIMSLWSEAHSPIQFEYWTSGQWREHEDYYMEEIFIGSRAWKNYPPKPNVMSHEINYPCFK